ncbi:hypothetical protein [Carboxylicivirga caseinilyticus]|uniref:hypothetical protein n=1 Tax=Carboxylicivirga caseinilyticus TaxID=3417572 RepID=UPI003D34E6E4|nr:hypothetical protein [Marinilabiliaceae bacterium A049]
MKIRNEVLNKLVENGTKAWTNIELNITNKIKVLQHINNRLAYLAEPEEENKVKIEIIRQSCLKIRNDYPGYANEVDRIINQFEHHLRFDNMAILPFKQLDALTYRIFIKQNLLAYTG